MELKSRYLGCLCGLAVGDAVGTTVEFKPRGSFAPVTDLVGGGPFGLQAGQWTDDTSMALCLAESLVTKQGFDAHDQMVRYLNWYRWGYLSSTGSCFDIGNTVRAALESFEQSGEPYSGSLARAAAGNGSLMRLAPVALYFFPNVAEITHFAAASSRTTHGAAEAVECCRLLASVLARCLTGLPKEQVLTASEFVAAEPAVAALAAGGYRDKREDQIAGTGYAVASLEAALWCFDGTNRFRDAVLLAANLGDDADTTAAIVGQIAGAFYGIEGIPTEWLQRLWLQDTITGLANTIFERAVERGANQAAQQA
jgi:ADP-ribosyl-[dinitrogen reductase] hydrolase